LACADCGPRLWFEGPASGVGGPAGDGGGPPGAIEGTDAAIAAAQRALARGAIVAIKGLGGYHLACDAASSAAVDTLRQRKARRDKPLAVMVGDLGGARRLAHIDRFEAALLGGPERPIVLLARRDGAPLAAGVAPHNPHIGLLLPYTPLHHLLFRRVPGSDATVPTALVMTSGNLADEPICYDDEDARARLGRIADAWLVHDRPIHVPCDDSVVRTDGVVELPIRRARGYAPLPVQMPFDVGPTLAMGGEIKNTFCLAAGRHAWVSQHIGDMGTLETLAAFERSARQFGDMYEVEPQWVAADAHPGYHTRAWAEDHAPGAVDLVHHHHAHIAAVMVEHGVPPGERVIGCAFDGTGYGTDGAIWGGEVLIASYDGFARSAHLRYVPLPGGDATIRKPSRAALAHLWAAGIEWAPDLPPVQHTPAEELTVLRRQLERNVQCVPTSSMGRLFDAVSSLLGVRQSASYEAQAAIELEHIADGGAGAGAGEGELPERAQPYRFTSAGDEIDAAPVLQAIVDDMRRGCAPGPIAASFHQAVAELIADTADRLREATGIERVALSGGVFQNVLLLRLARAALEARNLRVLTHRLVPPNDAGLSLGQVAVAGWRRDGGKPRIGAR
jgi:hydrogenase maturation protein HypF